MTREETEAIRTMVREEITAAVAVLQNRLDATDAKLDRAVGDFDAKLDRAVANLDAKLDRAVADIQARQERAVEVLTANMSELRTELSRRVDGIDRRFEAFTPVVLSLDSRMAGFTRAVDQTLAASNQMNGIIAAQGRLLEDLNRRVKALEEHRRESPPQP